MLQMLGMMAMISSTDVLVDMLQEDINKFKEERLLGNDGEQELKKIGITATIITIKIQSKTPEEIMELMKKKEQEIEFTKTVFNSENN